MKESKKLKERARRMSRTLKKIFPEVGIALNYKTPWELMVAVQLSAQCTDKRVNEITKTLFKKYRTLDDYVRVSQKEFEGDIRSAGYFRNKAKNIRTAAKMVRDHFGGHLPRTMEDMLTLPGVARKTANVVLSNAFGVVEGIAVDTHVRRFALRFDLTDSKDPKKIEQDFMLLFPKSDWNTITYRLIEYGRQICPARKHECIEHPLTKIYPPAAKNWPRAK